LRTGEGDLLSRRKYRQNKPPGTTVIILLPRPIADAAVCTIETARWLSASLVTVPLRKTWLPMTVAVTERKPLVEWGKAPVLSAAEARQLLDFN
jgi:hypothetical protein